jgi:hypothetical protein
MTQHYIGSKQVTAWPEEKDGKAGYAVKYDDGYISWSPKGVFERAYLPMGETNDGTRITPGMVAGFILDYRDARLGEKTTVVTAILANGFEVTATSSCVDPKNYDHAIGVETCKKRLVDQVWMVLGFLLQTARNGVVFANTDCQVKLPNAEAAKSE